MLIFKCDAMHVTPVNLNTGELLNYSKARYKNLEIIRLAGEVIFRGSLHKLFNDGKHNYNRFTFRHLVDTLISFCERFGINVVLVGRCIYAVGDCVGVAIFEGFFSG